MYCKYIANIKCEGPALRCRLIKKEHICCNVNNAEKKKYTEIRYITDNIQMLCIKNVYCRIVTYYKAHAISVGSEQNVN